MMSPSKFDICVNGFRPQMDSQHHMNPLHCSPIYWTPLSICFCLIQIGFDANQANCQTYSWDQGQFYVTTASPLYRNSNSGSAWNSVGAGGVANWNANSAGVDNSQVAPTSSNIVVF